MIETPKQKLLKSKRIKPTVRAGTRRKKIINRVTNKNKDETEFNELIVKLNNCILDSQLENHYYKSKYYIDQSLLLILTELRKIELNRKSNAIKTIRGLRKNWNSILSSILRNHGYDTETHTQIQPKNDSISFRNNYKFYKKNFSEIGYKFIITCLGGLYDDLLSKVYINEDEDSFDMPETQENIQLNLKRLNLSPSLKLEELSRNKLYNAYLVKTLEYHCDGQPSQKESEKYKIYRLRIKKALVLIDKQLRFIAERN